MPLPGASSSVPWSASRTAAPIAPAQSFPLAARHRQTGHVLVEADRAIHVAGPVVDVVDGPSIGSMLPGSATVRRSSTDRLLRRLISVAVAMMIVVAYGVAGYMVFEHSVVPRRPLHDGERAHDGGLPGGSVRSTTAVDIFTMTLLVAGVGVALIGISS